MTWRKSNNRRLPMDICSQKTIKQIQEKIIFTKNQTMKYLQLFPFLLLIPLNSYCQSLFPSGSYVIGAICKDGIILAEDSRMTLYKSGFVPSTGKPKKQYIAAYCDSIQKVFSMHNFAYCSSGMMTMGGYYIPFYLNKFVSKAPTNYKVTVLDVFNYLDTFFKLDYPQYLLEFRNIQSFVAGYYDDRPFLCAMSDGEKRCLSSGYVDTNDKSDFDKLYDSTKTCKEMADIIEKFISYIAKKDTNLNAIVARPIMVLKITPKNEFIWLKNPPKKPIMNHLNDFYDLYKKRRIAVKFISKKDKVDFDKAISQSK